MTVSEAIRLYGSEDCDETLKSEIREAIEKVEIAIEDDIKEMLPKDPYGKKYRVSVGLYAGERNGDSTRFFENTNILVYDVHGVYDVHEEDIMEYSASEGWCFFNRLSSNLVICAGEIAKYIRDFYDPLETKVYLSSEVEE